MDVKPIIEIHGLSKRYALGPEGAERWSFSRLLGKREREDGTGEPGVDGSDAKHIWALKDIDLDVYEGERVGIIGRNGAGKSTLLRILSRVIYPTEGEAVIRGRVTSLLEIGTGFNNNATGRENIYLNASLHGLSRREIDDRLEDIIAFAELQRFIGTPIKHYSSGMRSRLAFAVAAHLDPDILMLDEVLSVGDMAFQQKCLVRMNEVTQRGRTLLFVSHAIVSINQFCDRCVWIHNGRVVMDGPAETVTGRYSSELLGSVAQVTFERSSPPVRARKRSSATNGSEEPDKWAHLISASVTNAAGDPKTIFSSDEEVFLGVEYEITFDRVVYPAFRVYQDDILIFTIAYWQDDVPCQVGRYRAQARIPGTFLNLGDFKVSAGLNTPASGALIRHDVVEHALRFSVHDMGTKLTPRGPYSVVRGAVRPFFEWQTERLGEIDDLDDAPTLTVTQGR